MIRLVKAIRAWETPDFKAVLKHEVEQLDALQLPLQQGLSNGNYVADKPFSATVISVTEQENMICAKVGIFYGGVISGCSCMEDPASEINEYCEVLLKIDKATGATEVALVTGNSGS